MRRRPGHERRQHASRNQQGDVRRMTSGSRSTSWLAPAPPTVAIEIAARRVTVVQLGQAGGGEIVAAHASEALPADAVLPGLTTDNILEPQAVVDALRRAL